VILAAISSKIPEELEETDILLDENEDWFVNTGLRKSSILKVHKLLTVEKSYIQRELGLIPDSIKDAIFKSLQKMLKP